MNNTQPDQILIDAFISTLEDGAVERRVTLEAAFNHNANGITHDLTPGDVMITALQGLADDRQAILTQADDSTLSALYFRLRSHSSPSNDACEVHLEAIKEEMKRRNNRHWQEWQESQEKARKTIFATHRQETGSLPPIIPCSLEKAVRWAGGISVATPWSELKGHLLIF